MKNKIGFPFFFAVFLLIVSEYLFLRELYGLSRWAIMATTSVGIVAGIIIIVSVIRKYNS